jgi:serine/threonine-protein kinase
MGEVYRARDSRLERDVAIKILPEAFSRDADRLARFRREAQVLASLNHPHIAAIYGLEERPGGGALILELIEGRTLSDRIAQGPIAVEEALPIARQIAEALAAAHEHGVIHRDLKPANIKLTADGNVKVLDFGLAKALDASTGMRNFTGVNASASPTITSPEITIGGIILGTAAYMSPEQARGKPVDKRADIWAFGCVLYEMLTGAPAFHAEDVSLTLAEVMKSEPDWKALPQLPMQVEIFLRQCLRKDPRHRVSDINDVRLALEGLFEVPDAHLRGLVAANPSRRAIIIAAVAAVTIAALIVVREAAVRPEPQGVTRFSAAPAAGEFSMTGGDQDIAVSPDGKRIAYAISERTGRRQLYVRSMDALDAHLIRGLVNPRNPFFSSDGAWIGFFDEGALKRVGVDGGPALMISPVTGVPRGASWLGDTIIFGTTDPSTGILKVAASGGTPEVLTKPLKGDDAFPEWLPGGDSIVFGNSTGAPSDHNPAQIEALDLSTGERKVILRGGTNPRFASTGHLIYGYAGALRAVAFDVRRLAATSDPVPLVDDVVTKVTGVTNFGVGQNGTLAYVSGSADNQQRILVWVDRDGKEEPIVGAPTRAYVYPRISPDGRKVALDIRDQENDIWMWDAERRTLTRLTFDPGLNRGVAWSTDGTRIAFSRAGENGESIYWQPPDGAGTPEPLTTGDPSRPQVPYSFSPDGRLLFGEPGAPPHDLYFVDMRNRQKVALLTAPHDEFNAEVSPDGRWLAYQSNESGRDEIYVRPFPNVSAPGRWQVSPDGGTGPVWSRDGRELFYLVQATGQLVSVPVQAMGASFVAGTPQPLFEGSYFRGPGGRSFDVSPDGKRFLMIRPESNKALPSPQIVVVLNWFNELRRVPPAN